MKKILYRIILYANIVFAAALLLSYLSSRINPSVFWIAAFPGLIYPYLLAANILFVIVWIVKLKKEFLISLIIIFLGWGYVKQVFSFHRKDRDEGKGENAIYRKDNISAEKKSINILSYNVRLFNIFKQSKDANTDKKILELIANKKPDICCLQELYIDKKKGISLEELTKNLSSAPYSNIEWISSTGNDKHYGIATFSKFPQINKRVIRYPDSKNISIFSDVKIGKDTLRIFNNHLQSVRFKKQNIDFMVNFDLQSEEETIIELRDISSRLKTAYIKRGEQAKILADYIEKSPYPVVVCGDFNDTPVSYSYRKIKNGLNDAFTSSGTGLGNTYTGTFPKVRIDYILHSKDLSSSNFRIRKVEYSDHYPVSCSLYLAD